MGELSQVEPAKAVGISLSLSDRSFSITGDSDFVERYFDILLPLVQAAGAGGTSGGDEAFCYKHVDMPGESSKDIASNENPSLIERAEDAALIRFDKDTALPIVQTSVPGGNKREQMRNVALVLLFAANGPLPGAYIKEQCKKQSCLDANNFSKAYESDPHNFIKEGRRGSRDWTLDLTVPGRKTAAEFISQIIGKEN